MKTTNKQRALNNSGFTLLEVLIAVMVLAIVLVPLMHSFVSSHRINARSRQYMRATTLAQDEMEIFEREKLANLVDPAKYTYVGEDGTPPKPDSNGRYVFIRENIDNNSGSNVSKFDVEVTLDPERAASGSRYYDANNQALFYMNTIGRKDSAVYVQSVRNASNLKSYDDSIYEYFSANKASAGAGSSWSTERFEANLARRIKVKIYKENNGLNEATIVKVTYEYLLCANVIGGNKVMPDGYEFYSEESIIFDNSAQSIGEDGELPELKSVYLFYAPRYRTASLDSITYAHNESYTVDGEIVSYSVDEDRIVIENEAQLPIDVYVVRQDIFKNGSTTETEPVPIGYQPIIEIHDGMDSNHTIGNYFTNLNINEAPISGADGKGSQIDFSGLKDYANPSRSYSSTEAVSVIEPKPLDGEGSSQAEPKDRIYTMTVKVYKHGVDRTVANPIVTMTGSKLE